MTIFCSISESKDSKSNTNKFWFHLIGEHLSFTDMFFDIFIRNAEEEAKMLRIVDYWK